MTDLTGTAGHDDLVGTSSSASGSGRPKRRTFTAEYKLAILEEYDQADSQGRGALLRRERLMTLIPSGEDSRAIRPSGIFGS